VSDPASEQSGCAIDEEPVPLLPRSGTLLTSAAQIVAHVSKMTLVEVLTKALREGRQDVVATYRRALTASPTIARPAVDRVIAEPAAVIRAQYRFRPPDTTIAARVFMSRCQFFVTNSGGDLRRSPEFPRLAINGFL
jgi:hypothetical protein